MDLGQEHGQLQDLSSPILNKLQHGFRDMKNCLDDNSEGAFERFESLEGPNKSTMFVGWNPSASRMVLSCRIMDFNFLTGMREAKLATPPWLAHLGTHAQVEVNCLRVLQAFVAPQDGATDLHTLITSVTGDVNPRRIVCLGFCAAGCVSTLAAAWAAVQWPTADVRSISFGAPACGNADFAAAFKVCCSLQASFALPSNLPLSRLPQSPWPLLPPWGPQQVLLLPPPLAPRLTTKLTIEDDNLRWLMGISYRVMFRRDPVPTALTSTGLKHVHGAVYLCDGSMRVGSQTKGQIAPLADLGDHAFTGYSGALYASCKAHSDREQATGGACRAKLEATASSKSLRSQSSTASVESLSETVDSLQDGDETVALSQHPTGLLSYVRSGAGSLLADGLSLSKLAVGSAFARLGRLVAPKPKPMAGGDATACGHGRLAVDESARLVEGDGVVAPGDAYLIFGGNPPDQLTADTLAEYESGQARETQGDKEVRTDVEHVPIEGNDEAEHGGTQAEVEQSALPVVTSLTNDESGEKLSGDLVTAVMLDKRLASLNTDSTSISSQLLQATGAQSSAQDTHSIMTDASKQVTKLGMAAIAVNEAEVSLGEVAGEGEQGVLAPGVSLPAGVIEDSLAAAVKEADNEAALTAAATHTGLEALSRRERMQENHPRLARAFSLLERDSWKVDQSDLSNLQKVLVMGKISQAAIVAGAAYRNQETFRHQTGIANSRLIRDRRFHDTKVHVGWLEGGTAVFAFRGTASRQDGLQDVKIFSRNIDYLQELYPGVKAHLGFLQQFAAVCHPERSETNMAAVLRELSGGQTPTRVICTGHSLGGALATLGAAWAALEYPDADIRCITFGSPRVANKVFGKAFNALVGTSLRLVHGFDPVPSLPPSLMYKHVPGVIHIKRDSLVLKHRPWHTMLRSSVTDHSMRKYSTGVYKHMPGGLEAHLSFFTAAPVAVGKLGYKAAHAARQAVIDTQGAFGGNGKGQGSSGGGSATDEGGDDRTGEVPNRAQQSMASSGKGRHRRTHSSPFSFMPGELFP